MVNKRRVILFSFGVISCLLLIGIVGGCTLRAGEHPSTLSYKLPTKLTIAMGETLPGTDIRYERTSEKGAYLRIKGQEALKRQGDSVDWSGQPLPGVSVDLRLRVAWHTEEALHLVGTAKIKISNVAPRSAEISTSSPLKYTGPVAYNLAKGAVIPGSTITFEGRSDDGANLGGIVGYPYRKGGDSIFWEGKLTDDVNIRLELRVVQFDDKGMRTAGIVTLWLGN